MGPPDVSKLKTEIAVLEGIIREKKEQLRIAETIEKQKDDLWRKHVAEYDSLPPESTAADDQKLELFNVRNDGQKNTSL